MSRKNLETRYKTVVIERLGNIKIQTIDYTLYTLENEELTRTGHCCYNIFRFLLLLQKCHHTKLLLNIVHNDIFCVCPIPPVYQSSTYST